MDLLATTLGLFPLPDAQRELLAERGGRRNASHVVSEESSGERAPYDAAREGLVARQREAGLDLIVEGQARWEDMLAHPLCVHEHVRPGSVERYYDNNNFYRRPVVEGELTPSGDLAADLERVALADGNPQAVVPGPYSLADLATDAYYGDGAFLDAVAEFLAGEVAAFPEETACVFVLEPSLVTNPPDADERERVRDAVDTVVRAAEAPVVLQASWGALGEALHAHLLDTGVSALGYDLVCAHEESAYLVQEYGTAEDVALGVVDGQNTHVEDPETVRERVRWFRDSVPVSDFDTVYVAPNTGLFYLPVNRFEAKLDALGASVDLASEAAR